MDSMFVGAGSIPGDGNLIYLSLVLFSLFQLSLALFSFS